MSRISIEVTPEQHQRLKAIRLSTVEVFREAGRIRPVAARSWLERLADISFSAVQGGFAEVPHDRIAPVAIEFALKMLELNRQHLLALHEEFR